VRLLETLGADRRMLVRPHIGDASTAAMFVDRDQVADVRELPVRALVLAGRADTVRLNELHVVGLHGVKHTAGVA
jgi:hypothetical protein